MQSNKKDRKKRQKGKGLLNEEEIEERMQTNLSKE